MKIIGINKFSFLGKLYIMVSLEKLFMPRMIPKLLYSFAARKSIIFL
jgi:hypothetical protein